MAVRCGILRTKVVHNNKTYHILERTYWITHKPSWLNTFSLYIDIYVSQNLVDLVRTLKSNVMFVVWEGCFYFQYSLVPGRFTMLWLWLPARTYRIVARCFFWNQIPFLSCCKLRDIGYTVWRCYNTCFIKWFILNAQHIWSYTSCPVRKVASRT